MSQNKKDSKNGKFIGIPYDLRKPTAARFKSRLWNKDAGLFTPKVFGWGYDINFYRLLHPFKKR